MTNEEFQKIVLEKLEENDKVQKAVLNRFSSLEEDIKSVKEDIKSLEEDITSVKEDIKNIKIRQDDIYQVVTAIEHSNQVGRSELNSQNIRIAKLEGKFKKAGKVFIDEVDMASNL